MKIEKHLTDDAVLTELGKRLARTRLERNWTQAYVAQEAGVSKRTLERLEMGAVATQLSVLIRVCRVLHLLDRFDSLIPEPVLSPIQQLKLQGRQRQRASSIKTAKARSAKWHWVDQA